MTGAPFEARERVLEQRLDRVALGLPLPADQARAVVADGQLEGAHRRDGGLTPTAAWSQAREPGFTIGLPAAHSGHASGW